MSQTPPPNPRPDGNRPTAHTAEAAARRDRAVEPEYASISGLAITALVLSVLGALAFLRVPMPLPARVPFSVPLLIVLPIIALAVALAARRKIIQSEGTRVGLGLTRAAMLVSVGILVGAGGLHAWWQYRDYRLHEDLLSAAEGRLGDLTAGRYREVYDTLAANNPAVGQGGLTYDAFSKRLRQMLGPEAQSRRHTLLDVDIRPPREDDPVQLLQGRVVYRFFYERVAIDMILAYTRVDAAWKLTMVHLQPRVFYDEPSDDEPPDVSR